MSFKNFLPNVYAADVLTERDKIMIAAKHCNMEYEGEIKGEGDRVKILTVGAVSTKDYDPDVDLDDPDRAADAAQWLDIDKKKYAHVYMDDIDKRMKNNQKFWDEQKRQMAIAHADDIDASIFGLYKSGVTLDAATVTSANIIHQMLLARERLKKANVRAGETIYFEASPEIYTKIIESRIAKETANTKVIDDAEVPIIAGFAVYESNNVKSEGGVNYCFARTKRAIALAVALTETEAYRPQKRFRDAIKSLQVWGTKVVVPKELIVLPLTAGSET